MRLKNKTAIIVGGGQQPGDSIGNGEATALLFAREGASVVIVDKADRAQNTADMITAEGGQAFALTADVTDEESLVVMVARAHDILGRVDILHNNVGWSLAGDSIIENITEENFDNVVNVNLRGMVMTCKHVLPIMREQKAGSYYKHFIDGRYRESYPYVAYKASKSGVIAMTEQLMYMNFQYNIRANVILPINAYCHGN